MSHENQILKTAHEKLIGRTIADVRFLTPEEMDDLGWYDRAPVLVLDDNNAIFPSQDPEGNGAGCLFLTYPDFDTMGATR